jgi:DNA polymerase I-like protein with 3'-5' exonuclease and polymerase domains/uracil-DNA glycosylase
MSIFVPSSGFFESKVWIVGEAPGLDEELAGEPFVGVSGQELNRQLREAGIDRSECYVTNVCPYRPPGNDMGEWLTDKKTALKRGFELVGGRYAHPHVVEGRERLLSALAQHKPTLVIGFGNTSLWAMTSKWGIGAWRGSEMTLECGSRFVPTLHPAAVLRSWDQRPAVIHDLKYRCTRRLKHGFVDPVWDFSTFPTFDEAMNFIAGLHDDVAMDIETIAGHTVCIGIATSSRRAMCIPFLGPQGTIWSQEESDAIMYRLHMMVKQGSFNVVGQNWAYDRQYLQEDFKLDFRPSFDTLIAQSVLFPGNERGLGYLSSMYCDWHQYWKEDGKEWNKGIKDFAKEFVYNCRDVCATWEIAQTQSKLLTTAGLTEQFESRMSYGNYVYDMMRRGVLRDQQRTETMIGEVNESIHQREMVVAEIAGHAVNFASPKQVSELLFKEKGLKPVGKTTKGGAASTNDDALKKLVEKYPEASALCTPILEARSLSTIKATFLEAETDPDGQLRASWMATGTETFRCTSSKNAFHRGGPLQNITDGKHTHSGRRLPNLRSTIVPPPGCVIWNCDLERADLQAVAWEADDLELKKALLDRVDLHLVNAVMLFDIKGVTYDECFESHPKYKEHKEEHEQKRHFGKTFVHLTNYGGGARTCAIKTHSTVHQADLLQRRWFQLHPGILDWHRRTRAALLGTRTVRNRFGYRRVYFDRVDGLLPEVLAWVPQSTTSIVISLMHMAIEDKLKEHGFDDRDFGITLQVHDSLTGYYRQTHESQILSLIHSASKQVIVPYDDPLWIPLELSTSESSWGEVEKRQWPGVVAVTG